MTIIGIAPVPATPLREVDTVALPLVPTQRTCPTWCAHCIGGDVVNGVSTSALHEAVLVDVTGSNPATVGDFNEVTARVYLEQVDDPDEPAAADPTIVLALADGDEGLSAGEAGVTAWSGSPEQARQIAAALYRAAALYEASR